MQSPLATSPPRTPARPPRPGCAEDTAWLLVTNGDNEYGDGFLARAAAEGRDPGVDIVAFDFYSRYARPTAPQCERLARVGSPGAPACKRNRLRWCHTDLGSFALRAARFQAEGRGFGLGLRPAAAPDMSAEHADGQLVAALVQDLGWRAAHVTDACLFSHSPSPAACAWAGGVWDDRNMATWHAGGGECIAAQGRDWVLANDPNAELVSVVLATDGNVSGAPLPFWGWWGCVERGPEGGGGGGALVYRSGAWSNYLHVCVGWGGRAPKRPPSRQEARGEGGGRSVRQACMGDEASTLTCSGRVPGKPVAQPTTWNSSGTWPRSGQHGASPCHACIPSPAHQDFPNPCAPHQTTPVFEGGRSVVQPLAMQCLRRRDYLAPHVWGAAMDWYSELCADDLDLPAQRAWQAQRAQHAAAAEAGAGAQHQDL